MLEKLTEAIRCADKLLEPYSKEQIENGHVTIANKYHILNDMYLYFRNSAKKAFQRPTPESKIISYDKNRNPTGWRCDITKNKREGFFNTTAMVDSFFSRLEHLLILLLPFRDYNHKKDSLIGLIDADWGRKYKRIFDVNDDKKAKHYYDRLISIKEKFRNTLSHGFFEKNGASLFFHMEGLGAIPCHLSSFTKSIHYSFYPIEYESFKEICQEFDRFDRYLRDDIAAFGFKYIESGLNIAFDNRSIIDYKNAMNSEATFNDYIDKMSDLTNNAANMDW